MSNTSTKRILTYTALFTGGSILAAPAMGMGAGVVVSAAAVAGIFGNTLASDIHDFITTRSIDSLPNQHLRQLVGEALSALIECYRQGHKPDGITQSLVSAFRRPEVELSALAKAAKTHWGELTLTSEGMALEENQIHKAFFCPVETDVLPFISVDEWDTCLKEIAALACTRFGEPTRLPDEHRRCLAEYIAIRFTATVRELVQADLDPSVGTGGRIFIALHLDMMRTMATSLRAVSTQSDNTLAQITKIQSRLEILIHLVIDSLTNAQRAGVSDLIATCHYEHEQTRVLISQANEKQSRQHEEILAQLQAIRSDLAKQSNLNQIGNEPLDHVLSALQHLVDSGKARGSSVMQLSRDKRYSDAAAEAFKLAQDETTAAEHLAHAAKDARLRTASHWLDAGDIAFISDRQKAAEAYRRCTEIDPSNPFGWSRLGEVSWWVGQMDTALHAFKCLWYKMPEGVQMLIRGTDPVDVQKARFLANHPNISHGAYVWSVRAVVIAGLNIIEILQCTPSLITQLDLKIIPVTGLEKPRALTVLEAEAIIDFFKERIYSLGEALGTGASIAEHRNLLENLSRIAHYRNEFKQSEEYLQRARKMSVEQQDFVAEAAYLSNLGVVAAERGNMNTAQGYLTQALAICKGNPNRGRLFVGKQLISKEEAKRRELEHEQRMAFGIPATEPADDEIEVCNLLDDEFVRDTETAMQKAIKLKEIEGSAYGNLAHIAERNGDIDLAQREYKTSLAIHESIGFTKGITITRAALSRLNRAY